jgi:hypothetical protein
MMNMTLLQMTQDILSSMGSDEVNSIGDTIESMQVANIIKNKYFDVINRADLPEHYKLFQLNPSLDFSSPVLMYVPSEINNIKWIKYFDTNVQDGASLQSSQFGSYHHDLNVDLVPSGWSTTSTTSNTIGLGTHTWTVAGGLNISPNNTATATATPGNTMSGTVTSYNGTQLTLNITAMQGSGTFTSWTIAQTNAVGTAPGYVEVCIVPLRDFLEYVNRFNPTDQDVLSYTFQENGYKFKIYYKNDHRPTYCTVIANSFVLFDTFDGTQDSTLQGSKTMCWGETFPNFLLQDNFIPSLNDQQFPLLFNESKVTAWYELRQLPHQKAQKEANIQWTSVQKEKSVSGKPTHFQQLPNFGRRIGRAGYALYGSYDYDFPHTA